MSHVFNWRRRDNTRACRWRYPLQVVESSIVHEPTKRVGAGRSGYGEPDTPGIVLSLVLRGSRFPMTNLDGTRREPCGGHPGLRRESVHQPMSRLSQHVRLAADTILIGPHHASAELVENAEGRLIARQAKLSLKLNRRDAGRLAGDQISRPKPCAQRHMARSMTVPTVSIVAALATAQDTGTSMRKGSPAMASSPHRAS